MYLSIKIFMPKILLPQRNYKLEPLLPSPPKKGIKKADNIEIKIKEIDHKSIKNDLD